MGTYAHTIHCDHDGCDDYSLRVSFKPATPDEDAKSHRSALAADGWADREARMYCPDHS